MKAHSLLLLFLTAMAAFAGPRTSLNYTIATDTTDIGGQRAVSASYTHDGSAGTITGISTVSAPAETAKAGFIGQLFDVTGLVVSAPSPTLNEGASMQMGAWLSLDDATYLAIDPLALAWGPVVGPLVSIGPDGKATADIVYQNATAGLGATFGEFITSRFFTVVNVTTDDFGSYAGDGLGDDWQVQYFGFNNPLAAPALDPDGDGQTNSFEFTAGLAPTDPASHFRLRIEIDPDQAGHKRLIFGPLVDGRTYIIEHRANLGAGQWTPLSGAAFIDNAGTRTVTDPNADDASRFYRVLISRP